MVEATKPAWQASLEKSVRDNLQLEFSRLFQVALFDEINSKTVCDTLKMAELQVGKVLAVIDARADVSQLLLAGKHVVELNWLFQLTKEKYRLQCSVSQVTDQPTILRLWRQLQDDQQLAFKAPKPGADKAVIQDCLQQYEP